MGMKRADHALIETDGLGKDVEKTARNRLLMGRIHMEGGCADRKRLGIGRLDDQFAAWLQNAPNFKHPLSQALEGQVLDDMESRDRHIARFRLGPHEGQRVAFTNGQTMGARFRKLARIGVDPEPVNAAIAQQLQPFSAPATQVENGAGRPLVGVEGVEFAEIDRLTRGDVFRRASIPVFEGDVEIVEQAFDARCGPTGRIQLRGRARLVRIAKQHPFDEVDMAGECRDPGILARARMFASRHIRRRSL